MQEYNPFYCDPTHTNYNRRAYHHDYTRSARYLITFIKQQDVGPLSNIKESAELPVHNAYCELSVVGRVIPTAIDDWLIRYPQIKVPVYAVMPDHLHVCVNVTDALPNGLSRAIGSLKGSISSEYHFSLPDQVRPQKMQTLFEKGFNDRIAYSQEQWERQIHYTLDNPRRFLLKRAYPDFMLRRWQLTVGKDRYIAKGNVFLLKQPHVFHVKFSRRYDDSEKVKWMEECRTHILNGGIPVSPFIHPMEKAIRDYAVEEGYGIVRVTTNGFAERESATGAEFELMAQGRLLLIAPKEHSTRKESLSYSWAQQLNGLAMRIVNTFRGNVSGLIRAL
ncbi:MAG: hypothetical protein HDS43_06165 [Bacteroides sp.]|nr:hypothetical protein [Bacteroides sp.]